MHAAAADAYNTPSAALNAIMSYSQHSSGRAPSNTIGVINAIGSSSNSSRDAGKSNNSSNSSNPSFSATRPTPAAAASTATGAALPTLNAAANTIAATSTTVVAPSLSAQLQTFPASRHHRLTISSRYFASQTSRDLSAVHRKAVRDVAWSCNGAKLATGGADQIIGIWSIDSRRNTAQCEQQLTGHHDSIDQLTWSPLHADVVASASSDKSCRIWDIRSGRCSHSIVTPGENINISWSTDCVWIAVANKKNQLSLIDCKSWRIVVTVSFAFEISEIAFVKNNSSLLLITTGRGTLEIYRITSTPAAATASTTAATTVSSSSNSNLTLVDLKLATSVEGHTGPVYCVDVDPKHRYIATGASDAMVCIWDVASLSCIRTISRLESPIRTVSFSFDGLFLASASEDHRIDIADVDSGDLIHSVATTAEMNSMCWSPRHHLLAFATETDRDAKNSGNVTVFGLGAAAAPAANITI